MSDDSRGGSPDWLRNFQTPATGSIHSLSSDSGSSQINSSVRDKDGDHHGELVGQSPVKEPSENPILIDSGNESPENRDKGVKNPKNQKRTAPNRSLKHSAQKKTGNQGNHKRNGTQANNHDVHEGISDVHEREPVVEDASEKPVMSNVSSRLPLVISDKVHRSKALVECDDESIDLSGDVGAVGRIVISENSNDSHEMLLDLKGTIYKTAIVPSRTFCVVSFGQSEAKIEAIMNDFVQLKPHSSVFEAETVIEGVLDGFSFDMDDEGDRAPKSSAYQGAHGDKSGDHGDEKSQEKSDKSLGVKRKKATVAAKPPKRVARKIQTSRKAKVSKK